MEVMFQYIVVKNLSIYPFIKYDGTEFLPYPPLVENIQGILDAIKNTNLRSTDVILCSPMKTGTHWIHSILSMLLAQKADYNTKGAVSQVNLECSIGYNDWEKYGDPRLFHTHLPYRYLPEKHASNKIIYINRNPKDRWVSEYEFLKGKIGVPSWTWDEFFDERIMKDNLLDGWFKYTKTFEKVAKENENVFKVTFEELKVAPLKTIEKLAEFLGVTSNAQLLNEIVVKCKLDNLKGNIIDGTRGIHPQNESTLFRKGVIGDWKNWFTVAQNEQFDKLMDTEMAGTETNFVYTDEPEASDK